LGKHTATQKAVEGHDRAMLRRQEQFRLAAEYVAGGFAAVPGVSKVVLFGSVARSLEREAPRYRPLRGTSLRAFHECRDVDLAVWLSDLTQLRALQRARSDALKRLLEEHNVGVAHHQLDVFILEPGTDRLLGWLCHFTACPKEGKSECLAPGCGSTALLRQFEGFVFDPTAVDPGRSTVLYEGTPPAGT
jgi:hypothetical protein